MSVVEVKGLRDKKRYYVEVLIDDKLYARTASKKMTGGMCFWGENFSFRDLPRADKISLLIHKVSTTCWLVTLFIYSTLYTCNLLVLPLTILLPSTRTRVQATRARRPRSRRAASRSPCSR